MDNEVNSGNQGPLLIGHWSVCIVHGAERSGLSFILHIPIFRLVAAQIYRTIFCCFLHFLMKSNSETIQTAKPRFGTVHLAQYIVRATQNLFQLFYSNVCYSCRKLKTTIRWKFVTSRRVMCMALVVSVLRFCKCCPEWFCQHCVTAVWHRTIWWWYTVHRTPSYTPVLIEKVLAKKNVFIFGLALQTFLTSGDMWSCILLAICDSNIQRVACRVCSPCFPDIDDAAEKNIYSRILFFCLHIKYLVQYSHIQVLHTTDMNRISNAICYGLLD